jgi:hypothetical protein
LGIRRAHHQRGLVEPLPLPDEVVDEPPELAPKRCLLPCFFFEEVLDDPPLLEPEPDIELPVPPVLADPAAPDELPPDIPPAELPPVEDPPPDVPPEVCANAGAANRAVVAAKAINLFMASLRRARGDRRR